MIRVLIVEDDPMVADLAAMYLEGIEGFCLEGRASSGEAALELLRAGEIDLVLLDMFMPGMSGMELLRIIKTSFLNTDVIMICGAGGKCVCQIHAGCPTRLPAQETNRFPISLLQALLFLSRSGRLQPARLVIFFVLHDVCQPTKAVFGGLLLKTSIKSA